MRRKINNIIDIIESNRWQSNVVLDIKLMLLLSQNVCVSIKKYNKAESYMLSTKRVIKTKATNILKQLTFIFLGLQTENIILGVSADVGMYG